MSIVDINENEAAKKLQVATKFHLQILVLVFGAAVVFLFTGQRSLEAEFRGYMREDAKNSVQKVSENTDVLREIKGVLLENQTILKSKSIQ